MTKILYVNAEHSGLNISRLCRNIGRPVSAV